MSIPKVCLCDSGDGGGQFNFGNCVMWFTVLQPLPSGWADATVDSKEVTLCQISHHSSAVTPSISFTLKVVSDFSWTLFFYNQRVEVDSCSVLASNQSVLRSQQILPILWLLSVPVCWQPWRPIPPTAGPTPGGVHGLHSLYYPWQKFTEIYRSLACALKMLRGGRSGKAAGWKRQWKLAKEPVSRPKKYKQWTDRSNHLLWYWYILRSKMK